MTNWWELCWWTGGALGVVALVVAALALFRDRSRGRRRCPRCWYDMSGVAMTCPECGFAAVRERAFFRTHRHWRGIVLAGAIVLLGGAVTLGPAAVTGKWARYTPVPLLRVALALFEEQADAVDQAATRAGSTARLTDWEKLLLASDMARDLRWWLDASPAERDAAIKADSESYAVLMRQPRTRPPSQRRSIVEIQWEGVTLGDACRVALPELVKALESDDLSLHGCAVAIIGSIGPGAASAKPTIRRILNEAWSPSARRSCLSLLHSLGAGDRSTRAAIRRAALSDDDADVRHGAMLMLTLLETSARTTIDALLDNLDRGRAEHRMVAVRSLGWYARSTYGRTPQMGRFGAPPPRPAMSPPEPEDERVFPAIMESLNDPDTMVRFDTASTISGMGDRIIEAAEALRSRLAVEEHETVRRVLINAYVKPDTTDVQFILPSLMQTLRAGGDDNTRRWAAWALAACGARASSLVPELRRAAVEDVEPKQGIYCDTLGFIGGIGWDALDELVRDEPRVRIAAARSLGMAGSKHRVPVSYLLGAMKHADPDVRVAAALGLHYATGNQDALGALAAMVREDAHWPARRAALISIAGLGTTSDIVRACETAIRDAQEEVRVLSARTLAERAHESDACYVALANAAKDENPLVRAAASVVVDPASGELRGSP